MLNLSRKTSESIVFTGDSIRVADWQNDQIEVVVLEIQGDKVRLGIDCPDDVDVFRNEVWRMAKRKAKKENQNES